MKLLHFLQIILPTATETTSTRTQLGDLSFDEILKRISDELREVARRSRNSKLQSRNFEGLSTFLQNFVRTGYLYRKEDCSYDFGIRGDYVQEMPRTELHPAY